jgi:hypothetical protein
MQTVSVHYSVGRPLPGRGTQRDVNDGYAALKSGSLNRVVVTLF